MVHYKVIEPNDPVDLDDLHPQLKERLSNVLRIAGIDGATDIPGMCEDLGTSFAQAGLANASIPDITHPRELARFSLACAYRLEAAGGYTNAAKVGDILAADNEIEVSPEAMGQVRALLKRAQTTIKHEDCTLDKR